MNRRSFLAGTGTVGTGLLAGCSLLSDGEGSDPPFAELTRWVGPLSDATDAGGGVAIESFAVADPAEELESFGHGEVDDLTPSASIFARRTIPRVIDRATRYDTAGAGPVDRYTVYEGDVRPIEAHRAFTYGDIQYETLGTTDGWEFFRADDYLTAATDGVVVEARRDENDGLDRSALERVVETGEGDDQWLTDQHDPAATLCDRLERRAYASVELLDPATGMEVGEETIDGVTAIGATAAVEPEETQVDTTVQFRTEDDLAAAPVDEWAAQRREPYWAREVSVETQGRYLRFVERVAPGAIYPR